MAIPIALVSFLLLVSSSIQQSNGDPRTDIVMRECRKEHPRNTKQYIQNFGESCKIVQDQMHRNGFGFAEAGEPPNRVFLMAQCLGDLSKDDCNSCFETSSHMLPGCFPATGGLIYLDGCFIRADNYSFFNETTTLTHKRCGAIKEDVQKFKDVADRVISKVVKKAVRNDGYGDDMEEASNGIIITALANCWKMLDQRSCDSCLEHAAVSVRSCLPSMEGRVANAGCFLRYCDYLFVNRPKQSIFKSTIFPFISFVIGITTICTMAILIGIFAGKFVYTQMYKLHNKVEGLDMGSSLFKRSLRFKYSNLEKAIEYFSEANKLGEGGSSEVFKGKLGDGREIAVKRLFISYKNQKQEIYNEMNIISQAQHKNLVRFLGYSLTSHVSLFVYEFLPNRSLDCILFDPDQKKELDWKKRLGIILGTAEGLRYLHQDSELLIVHRDIKASNILLDYKYRPKIVDFGLARLCSSDRSLISTAIAGTLGYMAPEYIAHGKITDKIDVYSYGVLVLEIVSGVKNSKFNTDESLDTLVTSVLWHGMQDILEEFWYFDHLLRYIATIKYVFDLV